VTALACRSALARRGVAHLALAVDVQEQDESADKPSPCGEAQTASTNRTDGLRLPKPEAVAEAAALLNGAQKVAILAGRGALGARAELEQAAQLLGAPVVRRCSARRCCRTTTRSPPAASASTAPSAPTRRWVSATRC
jgi:pyruvate dehydrogenase (quinone)